MDNRPHVLVADDRADTRDLLKQLLEDDYRVSTAADGAEAIALIDRDRPDLLLLDLLMPGVDGFAVLEHLQAHPGPFLPVIVRSAVTDKEARLRALELGAHEFLCSPVTEDELQVRVRTMLMLKDSLDEAGRKGDALEAAVARRTRELQAVAEELSQASRAKDEFLSVMSHEMRTPLVLILAYAECLGDGLAGALSERQSQVVSDVSREGERMLTMVNNVLDLGLLAAGRFQLHPHVERYEPLVERALSAVRPLATERHVTLTKTLQVGEPVVLDDRRTVQVLTHLVENAVRFTAPGGRVEIKACLREGELVTEVVDTGMGIPAEQLPRLFQPDEPVEGSTARPRMGLSLLKGIVEAHGGRIGARSQPGAGSTFWFALPEHGVVQP